MTNPQGEMASDHIPVSLPHTLPKSSHYSLSAQQTKFLSGGPQLCSSGGESLHHMVREWSCPLGSRRSGEAWACGSAQNVPPVSSQALSAAAQEQTFTAIEQTRLRQIKGLLSNPELAGSAYEEGSRLWTAGQQRCGTSFWNLLPCHQGLLRFILTGSFLV